MSMPPVPEEIFVDAVKKCISANRDFIPPEGKGSLYLRPLLIALVPSRSRSRALVHLPRVLLPVAPYFKGGQLTPIDLGWRSHHRAAPGSTSSTKCIGNYSPVLKVQLKAKEEVQRRHLPRRGEQQVH